MSTLQRPSGFRGYVLVGASVAAALIGTLVHVGALQIFLFAVSSFILVTAFERAQGGHRETSISYIIPADWGIISLSSAPPARRSLMELSVKELILWAVLVLGAVFLMLLVVRPNLYYKLAREDFILENVSAIMLFLSFGNFFLVARKLTKVAHLPRVLKAASWGLAFGVLFLAMEEISWFQRVFHVDTPELFSSNEQREINIHNFATNASHNAYYILATSLFLVLPYLKNKMRWVGTGVYSFLIPSRLLLFASLTFVAYHFDIRLLAIWQNLSYFAGLFILMYFAWFWRASDKTCLLGVLVAYYVATPIMLVMFQGKLGDNIGIISEYEEFIISVCFLLWSLEVVTEVRIPK